MPWLFDMGLVASSTYSKIDFVLSLLAWILVPRRTFFLFFSFPSSGTSISRIYRNDPIYKEVPNVFTRTFMHNMKICNLLSKQEEVAKVSTDTFNSFQYIQLITLIYIYIHLTDRKSVQAYTLSVHFIWSI